MPMLIPLVYFVTSGYEYILENLLKKIITNNKIIKIVKFILYVTIFIIVYKFIELILITY